jgi:hypothetical protein
MATIAATMPTAVFVMTVKKRYMPTARQTGRPSSPRIVTPSRNPSVTKTASAISAARMRDR